jgi:DNA polymerase-3 subunit delta
MIVRQYRLLIQIKELSSSGLSVGQIATRLRTAPFVVHKIAAQARRFSLDHLLRAYQRLVEADEAIKTGRLEAALALELLVSELAQPP